MHQAFADTTIVDAHLDLAYNAALGYDIRLPLDELRASPVGEYMRSQGQTPTVSLPELQAGHVNLVFGTIFVLPTGAISDLAGPSYATVDEAFAIGTDQNDYYDRLAADGLIRRVLRRADLAPYAAVRPDEPVPVGLVTLMENADAMRSAGETELWFERGVRIIGPAWRKTRYCGGTGTPGGLTPEGRDLMGDMHQAGMALDMSHMAEESFWQAFRLFKGPVIASHANCRSLVPTDRHLSDDMIRAVLDRDGIIGVVLYNQFLNDAWTPRDGKDALTLETVVRHIEHICEIATMCYMSASALTSMVALASKASPPSLKASPICT